MSQRDTLTLVSSAAGGSRGDQRRSVEFGLGKNLSSCSLALLLALHAGCSSPSNGTPAPPSGADQAAAGSGRGGSSSGSRTSMPSGNHQAGVISADGGEANRSSTGQAGTNGADVRNKGGLPERDGVDDAAAREDGAVGIEDAAAPANDGAAQRKDGAAAREAGAAAGEPRADSTAPATGVRPFRCGASKSPLFQGQAPLSMRIAADFARLNGAATAEESGSLASVQVNDENGVQTMAANIVARGNSRFSYCQFRPFSLKFAEKQKGNVFEHLGKSLKFVSHCGSKEGVPGDTFKAESPEAYEQRVAMEHSVYQVLDQLGVPSLKTRLIRVTYEDTPSSHQETHLAFALEPEDEMAKRCGLVKSKDANLDASVQLTDNRYARMLIHLLNAFIVQYDWGYPSKNVVELVDLNLKELFYAPYDFDLVGIFRPDYVANHNRSLQEIRDAFADWLRRNQTRELFAELDLFLDRAEAMRNAFQSAELSETSRGFFERWFAAFMGALRDFRSCEGLSSDPVRPACYVADDYGAALTGATAMKLGEWTTRIEPPGDRDMFAVELNAGALYTLGGKAQLELLDEQERSEARYDIGAPVSFRPSRSGRYYLRASAGEDLVVSPFFATPDVIERDIFLYADDAGASLETAAELHAGQTFIGKWELSKGEDEDWLLLHTEAPTSLHVTLEGSEWSQGLANITRRDDPTQANEADLRVGDNDLSSFVAAPGDYVLKLVQIGGLGGSTSYAVKTK